MARSAANPYDTYTRGEPIETSLGRIPDSKKMRTLEELEEQVKKGELDIKDIRDKEARQAYHERYMMNMFPSERELELKKMDEDAAREKRRIEREGPGYGRR